MTRFRGDLTYWQYGRNTGYGQMYYIVVEGESKDDEGRARDKTGYGDCFSVKFGRWVIYCSDC